MTYPVIQQRFFNHRHIVLSFQRDRLFKNLKANNEKPQNWLPSRDSGQSEFSLWGGKRRWSHERD